MTGKYWKIGFEPDLSEEYSFGLLVRETVFFFHFCCAQLIMEICEDEKLSYSFELVKS